MEKLLRASQFRSETNPEGSPTRRGTIIPVPPARDRSEARELVTEQMFMAGRSKGIVDGAPRARSASSGQGENEHGSSSWPFSCFFCLSPVRCVCVFFKAYPGARVLVKKKKKKKKRKRKKKGEKWGRGMYVWWGK